MKTKLLLIISFFFVSISISLAQNSARNAPLPGSPEPIPPPGCIPPAVPVVTYYVVGGQTIAGELSWKAISGATGYRVWVSKSGSSTATLFATVGLSTPHAPGVYSCIYSTLPTGSYNFNVQSFNSGCSSTWSATFPITITGPPVPQDIAEGNNPYDVDLLNLLLDYNSSHSGDDLIGESSDFGIDRARITRIYPNPVGESLNVSLPFEVSQSAKFLVNDINGHSINNLPTRISLDRSAQIETSSISQGIYFLTVISGSNSFKQRFIKK